MALMGTTTQQHGYACKCLNIRVKPQPTPGPPSTVQKEYDAVYAGDEGLSVTHIQLTLRSRTRPVKEQDGRTTRYTSLTCLLCQTPAYRVHQVVDPEIEDGEGPVIPAEDWAEQDMLKSSSGWVEVYKGCLAGEAIVQVEHSTTYSKLFGIVLPANLPPDATQPVEAAVVPQHTGSYLPPLPPVFQPPPFTPSHPAFTRLSSIAVAQSSKIRDAAEETIMQVVRDQVGAILSAEADLRYQVEHLWGTYVEGLAKMEGESEVAGNRVSLARRRPNGGRRVTSMSGDGSVSTSVRISEFVLPSSPPVRRSSPEAAFPKFTSALSASLATSSFHYPRAREPTSPQPSSPRTASSRTMPVENGDAAASIREAHRRNMDEAKDVATSFRYVTDLEEQMEGMRGRQRAETTEHVGVANIVAETSAAAAARSVGRSKSPRGQSEVKKSQSRERKAVAKVAQVSPNKQDELTSPGEKGKRKVTFSVQPEVAIIAGEPELRPEPQQILASGDELFVMEGETGAERQEIAQELGPQSSYNPTSPVTADSSSSRRRTHRSRKSNEGPISFASLRPASLPTPSHMRPPERWSEPPSPTDSRSNAVRESLLSPPPGGRSQPNGLGSPVTLETEDEDEFGLREAEILRLVNAGTPSHRSAWKKDSKAWQLFVNRSERRAKESADAITEEEEVASSLDYASPDYDIPDDSGFEDEDNRQTNGYKPHEIGGIAQSLPIPIGRPSFGPPVEQLKTSLADRPGTVVPAFPRASSSSMRKAAYAERDRSRSIDPGALDFVIDEDEEEDDEVDPGVGSTARQRALKILEARDRLPADGMWRSLAS